MAFKTGNNHNRAGSPGSIGHLKIAPKAPETAIGRQILYTGFDEPDRGLKEDS
jgi:hypothetical protein